MSPNWTKIAQEAVDEHQAMQKPSELAALLKLLAPRKIKNVLEIGGMYGGTMWCWSQLATGKLVCVDNQTLEGRMEFADCDFVRVTADSTAPATRDYVEALMQGEKFDFIFIDGDHRRDGVSADATNWMPLAAPNGVVAFHDICHRWMEDHDMWGFWREFSRWHVRYEIFDPSLEWGGIGVMAMSSFDHLGLQDTLPEFTVPGSKGLHPPHSVYPPPS